MATKKKISTAGRQLLTTSFGKTRTRRVGRVYADGHLVLTVRGSKRYVRVFSETFCEAWEETL